MKYLFVFLVLGLTSSVIGQNRYHFDETNIFEDLDPEIVLLKATNKPVTGTVYDKYINGQLMFEHNYKDGLSVGWQRFYSESGSLLGEVNLIDGNGVYKVKDESGQLKWEGNYKDGKLNGLQRYWYQNGQLNWEENYKDGKKDGLCRQWYVNGQLNYEKNYKEDHLHGLFRNWYENGQLWHEWNYKEGELDGLDRTWHENGQLEEEKNYKEGWPISKKCWDEEGNAITCD